MRKVLFPLLSLAIFVSCNQTKDNADLSNDVKVKSTANESGDKRMQSEFADAKYTDIGKRMMADFTGGNMDSYGEYFADNAVYQWSAGDSLAGKKAIVDYWKARFAKVVQSVAFTNDIWLPIQVNVPQRGPDVPGVWLLNWQQVKATYKNGKVLNFWIHQDLHFDNNNKVDRMVMYIDRGPINAEMGVK